jgi:hypothetical protein
MSSKFQEFRRDKRLNMEAEDKANRLGLGPEDSEKYMDQYVEETNNLNEKLEEILDNFFSEGMRILRDTNQAKPIGIFTVLQLQEDRLRLLAQSIVSCLEPILDPCFKECNVKHIKQILDLCNASTTNSLIAATDLLRPEIVQ